MRSFQWKLQLKEKLGQTCQQWYTYPSFSDTDKTQGGIWDSNLTHFVFELSAPDNLFYFTH